MSHFHMQVCEYRMTLSIVTFDHALISKSKNIMNCTGISSVCFLSCDLTSWILMNVTCAHLILYKGQNRIFFQVWELKEVKKAQLEESLSFLGWVCVIFSQIQISNAYFIWSLLALIFTLTPLMILSVDWLSSFEAGESSGLR